MARLLDLVDWREISLDLFDKDECRRDHHGGCQTHGWLHSTKSCPHARIREMLIKEVEEARLEIDNSPYNKIIKDIQNIIK
jgi:hypothetical protein